MNFIKLWVGTLILSATVILASCGNQDIVQNNINSELPSNTQQTQEVKKLTYDEAKDAMLDSYFSYIADKYTKSFNEKVNMSIEANSSDNIVSAKISLASDMEKKWADVSGNMKFWIAGNALWQKATIDWDIDILALSQSGMLYSKINELTLSWVTENIWSEGDIYLSMINSLKGKWISYYNPNIMKDKNSLEKLMDFNRIKLLVKNNFPIVSTKDKWINNGYYEYDISLDKNKLIELLNGINELTWSWFSNEEKASMLDDMKNFSLSGVARFSISDPKFFSFDFKTIETERADEIQWSLWNTEKNFIVALKLINSSTWETFNYNEESTIDANTWITAKEALTPKEIFSFELKWIKEDTNTTTFTLKAGTNELKNIVSETGTVKLNSDGVYNYTTDINIAPGISSGTPGATLKITGTYKETMTDSFKPFIPTGAILIETFLKNIMEWNTSKE